MWGIRKSSAENLLKALILKQSCTIPAINFFKDIDKFFSVEEMSKLIFGLGIDDESKFTYKLHFAPSLQTKHIVSISLHFYLL